MNDTEKLRLLHEAASRLLFRLEAVHKDPRYQSVWTVAQAHLGPYDGQTYTEAMATLEEALNATSDERAI